MKTRISIAALVQKINGQKIGILNHKNLLNGKKVFSAIGGACTITDRKSLEELFNTSDYESGEDARFKAPFDNMDVLTKILKNNFKNLDHVIDFSISRELEEELSTIELSGQEKPFLTIEQVNKIETTLSHGILSYSKERNTYIFFVYYDLTMSKDDFQTLTDNKEIRILSENEISSGITLDSIKIANNII